MNLIICITPLQVLIAEQIIRKTQGGFIGLYLPYGDNPKHQYYYQKLKSLCQKSDYIELKNKTWGERFATLTTLTTTLKNLGIYQQPIENTYLASLDVLFLQFIISKVKFNHLYTFDDGTANIFPNSTYFNPLPKSTAQKLFKKVVGISYPDIPSILAVSKKHYTIFANEKNIIDNLEAIQLFDTIATTHQPIRQTKKILLGQGLDNFIGENAYQALVKQMIQRFGITNFVPHPREKLDFSDLLTVIHSDKIIEDYLVDEIAQHPSTHYEIYTFMSTAVFSLKDFPHTDIFLVYNQALMEKFKDAYDFLASRGFTLIDMDTAVKETGFQDTAVKETGVKDNA